MIRIHAVLLGLLAALDVCVVLASFVISVALAIAIPESTTGIWTSILDARITAVNVLFVLAHLAFWQICLRVAGLYGSYRQAGPERELRRLGLAGLVAVAPVLPIGWLLTFEFATPAFVVGYLCLALLGLSVERLSVRALARAVRRRRNLRSVVIIGDPEPARALLTQLRDASELGYHVIENVSLSGAEPGAGLRRLSQLLEENAVQEVLLATDLTDAADAVREVIAACADMRNSGLEGGNGRENQHARHLKRERQMRGFKSRGQACGKRSVVSRPSLRNLDGGDVRLESGDRFNQSQQSSMQRRLT